MSPKGETPDRVSTLAAELARARPMRRGSLSERWMKCGKSACACRHDDDARHGPYLSVTRVVAGRTQSRYVNPEHAALVRRQIEAGRQFAERVDALRSACETWADAELEAASIKAPAEAEAEKGGSKRSLRTRSRKKSKR